MQQERLCGFNSLIEQVAPDGNTKRPFECAHETTRRKRTLFCKIGERQITIQMFVQDLDRSILLPDRQPPGNNLRRLALALVCAAIPGGLKRVFMSAKNWGTSRQAYAPGNPNINQL